MGPFVVVRSPRNFCSILSILLAHAKFYFCVVEKEILCASLIHLSPRLGLFVPHIYFNWHQQYVECRLFSIK